MKKFPIKEHKESKNSNNDQSDTLNTKETNPNVVKKGTNCVQNIMKGTHQSQGDTVWNSVQRKGDHMFGMTTALGQFNIGTKLSNTNNSLKGIYILSNTCTQFLSRSNIFLQNIRWHKFLDL